jgi:hypothetical protein
MLWKTCASYVDCSAILCALGQPAAWPGASIGSVSGRPRRQPSSAPSVSDRRARNASAATRIRRRRPRRGASDSPGAAEGTRTPTPLPEHGPEPCASANSATAALISKLSRVLAGSRRGAAHAGEQEETTGAAPTAARANRAERGRTGRGGLHRDAAGGEPAAWRERAAANRRWAFWRAGGGRGRIGRAGPQLRPRRRRAARAGSGRRGPARCAG